MSSIREIYNYLCGLAPIESQMDFDNSGLQVGRLDREPGRVLLALDICSWVIDEAQELGAGLIISHHPLIWGALKSLSDEQGEKVLRLAELGIGAISMHTNMDIARGGVNDLLIELLGARGEGPLDAEGCGRYGCLESPMVFERFLDLCREKLQANGLRYCSAGRKVYKLAVMGGSGGGAVSEAFRLGCDTYVTGDVKYDQFIMARELGLNLIDAGHFPTEDPLIPALAEKLSAAFPDTEFIVSRKHGQLISFA